MGPKVLPDYLTLVLNPVVTKLQAERDVGGSIIQHWKPSKISEVVIPIIAKEQQLEIAQLIQKSLEVRDDFQQLLDLAKHGVELAIEENEAAALAWIEEQLAELGIELTSTAE